MKKITMMIAFILFIQIPILNVVSIEDSHALLCNDIEFDKHVINYGIKSMGRGKHIHRGSSPIELEETIREFKGSRASQ